MFAVVARVNVGVLNKGVGDGRGRGEMWDGQG